VTRRRRVPGLAIATVVALALAGCGDDPYDAATPTPPASGPLARWRRAAETTPDGPAIAVEAVRPCVATLSLWEHGRATERERRAMSPGDVWKLVCLVVPRALPGALSPDAADAAAGRVHATLHSLSYLSDDHAGLPAYSAVWTRSATPWVRVQPAEYPPTSLDLPTGPLTLVAVGVAEPPANDADLRLDLSFPPRIAGPAPAAETRGVAGWVLTIAAP
jgi:hypothetical protein